MREAGEKNFESAPSRTVCIQVAVCRLVCWASCWLRRAFKNCEWLTDSAENYTAIAIIPASETLTSTDNLWDLHLSATIVVLERLGKDKLLHIHGWWGSEQNEVEKIKEAITVPTSSCHFQLLQVLLCHHGTYLWEKKQNTSSDRMSSDSKLAFALPCFFEIP